MNSTEIAGLLAKVKAATGPDRRLDYEIFMTLLPKGHAYLWDPEVGNFLTSSIDAALALVERVLPGCLIDLRRTQTGWFARLSPVDRLAKCDPCATGPSGALSLCAALLSAIPGGPDAER